MSAPLHRSVDAHRTLPHLLTDQATKTPNRTAIREKILGRWRETDWAGYLQRVQHFARGLEAEGFGRGDILAIASEDTAEWVIADLAAQALGGITAGIYPTSPWPEIRHVLENSRARFVVCGDQEQVDKVIDAAAAGLPALECIICVDMRGLRSYQEPRLRAFAEISAAGAAQKNDSWWQQKLAACTANDVCIIVYTSGTTGAPKGAQITHANLLHSADEMAKLYELTAENYEVLCYLPLCHIAERVMSMSLHLRTGGVVSFAESIDTVQSNIREIAPTVFLGVPRIWEKQRLSVLIRLKEARRFQARLFDHCYGRVHGRLSRAPVDPRTGAAVPGSLLVRLESWLYRQIVFRPVTRHLGIDRTRVRMCGAASVSPETLRFFEVLGLPIYQAYGATEFGISFVQGPHQRTSGCSGKPLPGISFRLRPDGELQVRSPTVFAGYLHNDEATRSSYDAEGWLNSGDIIELAENGEIRVVDRKKSIIVTSGGKNIAPSEIEDALKESLFIREAILLGEARHFVSALIQVDLESVGKWAQEQGLSYTGYASLSRLPEVRTLIAKEVDRVNARFSRVENVRKFVILSKELDHDDGELTATQKVRRSHIEKNFAAEIAQIYGAGEP